jgi:capsular exopolysaccharide synthesis family protein
MMGFWKKKKDMGHYQPITFADPHSIVSEQYRKLRTNIDLSDFNKEMKSIAITSSFKEEGKTLTCINLATVYAQSEHKTLLIDMDLRKPKIHRGFKLSNELGLSSIIKDKVEKEKAIQKVHDCLYVLPTGPKLPFPNEFLLSNDLRKLLELLHEEFDRIIIDTPPMTAVSDASIVSKYVDGTILVVASRNTSSDVAKEILKSLGENGANIIGSVLTRVRKKDHRYFNYYYYEEYQE